MHSLKLNHMATLTWFLRRITVRRSTSGLPAQIASLCMSDHHSPGSSDTVRSSSYASAIILESWG